MYVIPSGAYEALDNLVAADRVSSQDDIALQAREAFLQRIRHRTVLRRQGNPTPYLD